MKTKKIIAGIAITWMMLASTFAMYDENVQKWAKLDNTKQVKVMSVTNTWVQTMSWERVQEHTKIKDGTWENMWSSEMKGSGINNASWTGAMKSKKGQARAAEAKMKKEEAKEKMGQNSDKAEMAMNKFQEKFERKSKQDKLNQYQALGAKIDKTLEKFLNSDISEAKKEAYRNLFEYVRALNEEKIIELEESEEEVVEWTEAE